MTRLCRHDRPVCIVSTAAEAADGMLQSCNVCSNGSEADAMTAACPSVFKCNCMV